MFGHHDDTQTGDNQAQDASTTDAVQPVDSTPPAAPASDQTFPHPGQPIAEPETPPSGNVLSPAGGFPRSTSSQVMDADKFHAPEPAIAPQSDTPADTVSSTDTDLSGLLNIKNLALNELLPLIDKLDQTPEERFRTIMMLIQASDNKELVDKAYESAHKIEDEKVRAQALLDIVNEINYFTHNT